MGLAPYTADLENKEQNFLYQLKKNGYIEQLVFSTYMRMGN